MSHIKCRFLFLSNKSLLLGHKNMSVDETLISWENKLCIYFRKILATDWNLSNKELNWTKSPANVNWALWRSVLQGPPAGQDLCRLPRPLKTHSGKWKKVFLENAPHLPAPDIYRELWQDGNVKLVEAEHWMDFIRLPVSRGSHQPPCYLLLASKTVGSDLINEKKNVSSLVWLDLGFWKTFGHYEHTQSTVCLSAQSLPYQHHIASFAQLCF